MLRYVKLLLVSAVAAWGLASALLNFSDWPGTLDAVRATTSMSTLDNGVDDWRATDNLLLIWCGALFIVGGKLLGGGLCGLGLRRMWLARYATPVEFQAAKDLALAGCGVAVLMLFAGFVVIAEGWFELWRSDALRAPVLESAFRYSVSIGLVALIVGQPE